MVKSRMKEEKPFDMIFMDMHMPVMDGLEAAAEIFKLNISTPIIAMTANIMSNDLEIYRSRGMNDCVGKPFTSQELWQCLLKYLKPIENKSTTESQPETPYKNRTQLEIQRDLQLLFLKSNRNKYTEIVKALDEKDIKLAYRLAHTLKSNAAQIGKIQLQHAAADIEYLLKEGKNLVTEKHLKTFETELEAALMQLTGELEVNQIKRDGTAGPLKAATQKQPDGTDQIEPLDLESTLALIEKLEPLLNVGSPECNQLIGSLCQIQGDEASKIDEVKTLLIQQIEDFDFVPAIATLAELKIRMGLK
jgi:CheY-like chemotaxis protein